MRFCRRSYRDFLREEHGLTAGMEFVMFIPLMLGILAFAAEYANALMTKEAFESAVRDATRVLSRAGVAECPEPDAERVWCVEGFFDTLASQMVAARIGLPPNRVNFSAQVLELGGAVPAVAEGEDPLELRTPYYVIQVEADAALDLPLLRLINSFTANAAVARADVPLVRGFNEVGDQHAQVNGFEVAPPKPQDDARLVREFLQIFANDSARWVGENRAGCDIDVPLSCGGPD